MTITEFLLARIAEDESRAANVSVFVGPGPDMRPQYCGIRDRVLAECEAKRQLVERHSSCDDVSFNDASSCPDMRALAGIYASHPDFREEWRT